MHISSDCTVYTRGNHLYLRKLRRIVTVVDRFSVSLQIVLRMVLRLKARIVAGPM